MPTAIHEQAAGAAYPLPEQPIRCVVLASGLNRIPLYPGYQPGYKALLSIHGRASIHYVLDALEQAGPVGGTCIVGDKESIAGELAARSGHYDLIEGGDTLLESVLAGLQHFAPGPPVLFVTADLPLLTPEAVNDFLSACDRAQRSYPHNVFISAVAQGCYTGVYSQFPKTFNRYRDVTVCHGNLALVDPGLLEVKAARTCLDRMYAARKSPYGSALGLGWQIGLMYILGVEILHIVTIGQMARFASRRLGLGIVPVLVDHPEITIDVDEPADYEFVQRQLEDRSLCRTPRCA